jgi:hypothetical protein
MHPSPSRAALQSVFGVLALTAVATAGPFENSAVQDLEIRQWANRVVEFLPTASGSTLDLSVNALGSADGALVSLGELDELMISQNQPQGSITVSLPYPFANGDGWDFAVFENAGQFFDDPFIFAELAYVEVSSNGTDFIRFPSTSFNVEPGSGTPDTELTASFGRDFAGVNVTNIRNLAGIHPAGVGTGFDLSDLVESSLGVDIDLNAIQYVRLVDIPGEGSFLDAEGRGILDTWPGAADSGGFDLDALGTRYATPEPTPEPTAVSLIVVGLVLLSRGCRR